VCVHVSQTANTPVSVNRQVRICCHFRSRTWQLAY